MPDFPIIDSHMHIWDPDALDYPWLSSAGEIGKTHNVADFRQACGSVDVEAMVFLECNAHPGATFAEIDWVLEQADKDPRVKALVGFAPLDRGDQVRAHLEKLQGVEKVVGVRRIYQHDPDLSFAVRPDFITGVNALVDYGFSFDMCITHPHMEASIQLADACPRTPIVLDHLGKPGIQDGLMEPWRRHMIELSQREHVVCKLSGVATEADHLHWTPDQLRPYIEVALEAFGPDRLMFGGDWPVATSAIGYAEWVSIVDQAISSLSAAEQRAIYRGTASRFYQLGIEA